MTGEREFQEKIQQLGRLVEEMDHLGAGDPVRELVELLMAVHATGIERMMEIVFASGPEGRATIDQLGRDPIVRSLLVLYSLHPEDLKTRVDEALDGLRPQLRKQECSLTLVGLAEGTLRLKVGASPHRCGSTARTLRALIEENIYAKAPDLKGLVILGLDESAPGFVPLESLQVTIAQPAVRAVEAVGGG